MVPAPHRQTVGQSVVEVPVGLVVHRPGRFVKVPPVGTPDPPRDPPSGPIHLDAPPRPVPAKSHGHLLSPPW
jgi:hypothetical protein